MQLQCETATSFFAIDKKPFCLLLVLRVGSDFFRGEESSYVGVTYPTYFLSVDATTTNRRLDQIPAYDGLTKRHDSFLKDAALLHEFIVFIVFTG